MKFATGKNGVYVSDHQLKQFRLFRFSSQSIHKPIRCNVIKKDIGYQKFSQYRVVQKNIPIIVAAVGYISFSFHGNDNL